MANVMTLEEVKRHLNIIDYNGDDELLHGYITAAIGYVQEIICRDVDTLKPLELSVFKQAVLLVIGDFYMQREDTVVAVSAGTTGAVRRLTMSIRSWR